MTVSGKVRNNRWMASLVAFILVITTLGLVNPTSQAAEPTTAALTIEKSAVVDGTEF